MGLLDQILQFAPPTTQAVDAIARSMRPSTRAPAPVPVPSVPTPLSPMTSRGTFVPPVGAPPEQLPVTEEDLEFERRTINPVTGTRYDAGDDDARQRILGGAGDYRRQPGYGVDMWNPSGAALSLADKAANARGRM